MSDVNRDFINIQLGHYAVQVVSVCLIVHSLTRMMYNSQNLENMLEYFISSKNESNVI